MSTSREHEWTAQEAVSWAEEQMRKAGVPVKAQTSEFVLKNLESHPGAIPHFVQAIRRRLGLTS